MASETEKKNAGQQPKENKRANSRQVRLRQTDQPLSGAIDPPAVNQEKRAPRLFEKITPRRGAQATQKRAEEKPAKAAKQAAKPTKEETAKAPRQSQSAGKNGQQRSVKRTSRAAKVEKPSIKAIFLGGLNEIGKNMTLFECGEDMFLLDCGMTFPNDDMLGIDLVIPDFSYVERNKDRIRGIVVTHGHEDHIGGLPFLLKSVNLPIYGTRLTLGLISSKLREHNLLNRAKLIEVQPGGHIQFGCMDVELIHVNHSIPDAVAVAIHSPAGTVVHTGDFKIDCTPVQNEMIDLGRFAELGRQGVLALMADSTNAERPGYTMTEHKLNSSFETLFQRAENSRIIIASFASNISRIQLIINCALHYGRKVAFSGRSMINYVTIAQELGYLDVPEGVIIDIDLLNRYPKEKVVLITTGSQGEPLSALSRMANSDHRKVEVGPGDFIIISANPIPGNEKMVSNVVNELMKRGCQVIYESMYEVHVSGHACQEELKLMQGLTKPKYFIPVHGEQKHLHKHAELARAMGIPDSNIFIGDIGNVLEINENYMKELAPVPAGRVLVDGIGVGDVGSIVLRDRKHLGEDGLIVVVATIDSEDGHVLSGPDVVSRGFVYVRESEPLMMEAKQRVMAVLEQCASQNMREWGVIKTKVKDELSHLLYERTRRSPMILPVIMEV